MKFICLYCIVNLIFFFVVCANDILLGNGHYCRKVTAKPGIMVIHMLFGIPMFLIGLLLLITEGQDNAK